MRNEQLDEIISQIEGLHSAVWSDERGVPDAESTGFEGDVACAVAAICHGQLEELGQLLGAKRVEEFTIAASDMNVYVVNKGQGTLVALGKQDDKPTKTAEKLASLMSPARAPA